MKKIILATESKYKKSLFSRLNLDFESIAANIDETPSAEESARDLTLRLAREKAQTIASNKAFDAHWIIGADQAAECEDDLVCKPETHEQAVADLQEYSGKSLDFYTSICVISTDGGVFQHTDKTTVVFRALSDTEIENYLRVEQPYDCAGAFKAEGLGISLFQSIESADPSALIGLPLIELANFLRLQGFDCYQRHQPRVHSV